jgi:hypothetical protein
MFNVGIYKFSFYLAGNSAHLRYRAQPVNAVSCENHRERTDTLCRQNAKFSTLREMVHIVTTVFQMIKRLFWALFVWNAKLPAKCILNSVRSLL